MAIVLVGFLGSMVGGIVGWASAQVMAVNCNAIAQGFFGHEIRHKEKQALVGTMMLTGSIAGVMCAGYAYGKAMQQNSDSGSSTRVHTFNHLITPITIRA